MTAARVDLTVCSQKQRAILAGRQLLLDEDRACCISRLWSPTTLIYWGRMAPF